ncbi:uncharacterized protein TNCV_55651 [Trichonephila clavipes]|nr:uncharacterized protein TNCV_55651 [Trichonephila clavipes]
MVFAGRKAFQKHVDSMPERIRAVIRMKSGPSRRCDTTTVFMQDGAPSHIIRCVKQVLRCHFSDDRIIRQHFHTPWPPRSPDLNPCDFWL